MDQLNVTVLEGTKVLTLLQGEALEQKHPEKIKLFGDIKSVSNFLSKRYGGEAKGKQLQEVDKELAVVIVSKNAILLSLDPQNPFGTEVTANLEPSPELEQFHINANKQFSREELVKLIRYNKRFFDDPLKHEALMNAYLKLNLSTSSEIKSESDNRGNREAAFKKQINSQNIPTEFILNIPFYKGQPKERFRVEIALDATDASVRFWFESVELVEMMELRREELFNSELESCKDFVIIHK